MSCADVTQTAVAIPRLMLDHAPTDGGEMGVERGWSSIVAARRLIPAFTLVLALASSGVTVFADKRPVGPLATRTNPATVAAHAAYARVALDGRGTPAILWVDDQGLLFLSRGQQAGGFATPIRVPAPQGISSPDLVLDGSGNALVVWQTLRVVPNPNQKYPDDPQILGQSPAL